MNRDGQRVYCSRECYWRSMVGKVVGTGATAKHPRDYPLGFTRTFRKMIRERDGFTCQVCGKQEAGLHVHHIDYDKANLKPLNLVSLCGRCHGKTNHNRPEWREYFAINLPKAL